MINSRTPIKKLVIEEGVIAIGTEAFYDAGLEETILPESIEYIGESAFAYNDTTINLPENLTYIGEDAFYSTNLSGEIFIKNINIGESAFAYTKVNKVSFADDIEIITTSLFRGCKELNQVTLPKNLKIINENAFADTTTLKNIEFPETLITIGDLAFYNSGLTSLTFEHFVTIKYKAFYRNNDLTTINFLNKDIYLENYAFAECENLNNVNFSNMELIRPIAFYGSPLKNISLDETDSKYKIINGGIAYQSNNGYELVLGGSGFNNFDEFVAIREYALAGRKFANLYIGSNIKTIKMYAFSDSEIYNANINADIIESYAFNEARINDELNISSRIIASSSFNLAKNFKILRINEGTEIIESAAFVNNDVEKVYLPASLKTIEHAAFFQCFNLSDVYYELKEGTPIYLYTGNFIAYSPSNVEKDGKIHVYLNAHFKIYVYEKIYDKVKELWNNPQIDEGYIYQSNLIDHLEKR